VCYVDTGSTVIDTCNGLEWEKKDTAVGSGADAGNLHDVDNVYTWVGRCTISGTSCQPTMAAAAVCAARDGSAHGCVECGAGEGLCDVDPSGFGAITTIWEWVNQLNAASFAGHTDWRVPTFAGIFESPTLHTAELELIVDRTAGVCGGGSGGCIDPIFGPTVPDAYWSASPIFVYPPRYDVAWRVYFNTFSPNTISKRRGERVRAVRSAS
jgi:hypothetical protein